MFVKVARHAFGRLLRLLVVALVVALVVVALVVAVAAVVVIVGAAVFGLVARLVAGGVVVRAGQAVLLVRAVRGLDVPVAAVDDAWDVLGRSSVCLGLLDLLHVLIHACSCKPGPPECIGNVARSLDFCKALHRPLGDLFTSRLLVAFERPVMGLKILNLVLEYSVFAVDLKVLIYPNVQRLRRRAHVGKQVERHDAPFLQGPNHAAVPMSRAIVENEDYGGCIRLSRTE